MRKDLRMKSGGIFASIDKTAMAVDARIPKHKHKRSF